MERAVSPGQRPKDECKRELGGYSQNRQKATAEWSAKVGSSSLASVSKPSTKKTSVGQALPLARRVEEARVR